MTSDTGKAWWRLSRRDPAPMGTLARSSDLAGRLSLYEEAERLHEAMARATTGLEDPAVRAMSDAYREANLAAQRGEKQIRLMASSRASWPDDLARVQTRGRRRWPSLFSPDSDFAAIVDHAGEALLRDAAPQAQWGTTEAPLLDRDWQPVTSHRILQVPVALALPTWGDPVTHETMLAIPDDVPEHVGLLRKATGDGASAVSIFVSPAIGACLARAKVSGLEMRAVHRVAHVEPEAQRRGWKRLR